MTLSTFKDGGQPEAPSSLLGGLYNPFAAVPSLHFGGALAIGLGYVAASGVGSPAKRAPRWQADRGSAVAMC